MNEITQSLCQKKIWYEFESYSLYYDPKYYYLSRRYEINIILLIWCILNKLYM